MVVAFGVIVTLIICNSLKWSSKGVMTTFSLVLTRFNVLFCEWAERKGWLDLIHNKKFKVNAPTNGTPYSEKAANIAKTPVSGLNTPPPPVKTPIYIPLATSTTVLSGLDFCAKCDFCVKGWVRGICMWRILWFWCFLMIQ